MLNGRAPPLAALGLLAGTVLAARAAGGHFDVDDAAVLDPGRCLVESWLGRAPKTDVDLAHLGSACRVGPVELGVNLDAVQTPDGGLRSAGPQLKWVADPLVGSLSAGFVWIVGFDLRRGGAPAQTLYLPLTWHAGEHWAIHANVGADRGYSGAHTRRIGASAEWSATSEWTVIAERVQIAGLWSSRFGARASLAPQTSIDLSAAHVGADARRLYVIGLNHEFTR